MAQLKLETRHRRNVGGPGLRVIPREQFEYGNGRLEAVQAQIAHASGICGAANGAVLSARPASFNERRVGEYAIRNSHSALPIAAREQRKHSRDTIASAKKSILRVAAWLPASRTASIDARSSNSTRHWTLKVRRLGRTLFFERLCVRRTCCLYSTSDCARFGVLHGLLGLHLDRTRIDNTLFGQMQARDRALPVYTFDGEPAAMQFHERFYDR
jgi:hypothetical protein